ncbi:MAG: hypothetical protein RL757_2479 [Bacteroidota bacterium]|jgi:2-polyprenyl-6-methoxyphenol hydroxylase-like FAD-dependent oxidoreductase
MIKIDIIGGGMGGLTLGIALQKQGFSVQIFEQSSQLLPIGAGIIMASNAMQIAQKLGFSSEIRAQGNPLEIFGLADHRARLLTVTDMATIHEKYGEATVAIHRGSLQQILVNKLLPDSLKLAKKFQKFEILEDQTIKTTFEDGSTSTANLLIASDGIRSRVRQQLFGEMPLRYATHTCWRGVVEATLENPKNAAELWAKTGGKRVAMIQIDKKRVYFYFTLKKQAGFRVPKQDLKAFFENELCEFPAVYAQTIGKVALENVYQDDIYDLVPLKTWSSDNVLLMGDAAHATTPNLGQGGCQAIEDAYFFAEMLSNELKNATPQYKTDFSPILKRFEEKRRNKIKFVVDTSYQIGILSNVGGFMGHRLRNFLLRATPNRIAAQQFEKLFRL